MLKSEWDKSKNASASLFASGGLIPIYTVLAFSRVDKNYSGRISILKLQFMFLVC